MIESAEEGAERKTVFISRLTFKAISEIFRVMIKKELSKKGVTSANIVQWKENIKMVT